MDAAKRIAAGGLKEGRQAEPIIIITVERRKPEFQPRGSFWVFLKSMRAVRRLARNVPRMQRSEHAKPAIETRR
jgi:hypothetical protein